MTFKNILVHLDDSRRCHLRLGVATQLAVDFGAELVGLYVVPTRELAPSVAALLPADVVARRLQETGDAQNKAEALFKKAAKTVGLKAVEWRAPAGSSVNVAVTHARCTDLVVLGQRDPGDADFAFLEELNEAVVLSAGRPALCVPYAAVPAAIGQHVLVAWDGGREASRAVGDAMPLLVKASQITVMSVHSGGNNRLPDEAATARLAAYLRSHGVEAKIDHSTIDDIGIGEWLLSRAADLSADLIVMGAYAHTRLRELVLGGVTRTMLSAMTAPVLMSH
jgi:nucleotide-binding universal stress UspA family protein